MNGPPSIPPLHQQVIPYAPPKLPTSTHVKSATRSPAATTAYGFLSLATASVLILCLDLLLTDASPSEILLIATIATIPICLLPATILSLVARQTSTHPSGPRALCYTVAGWVLLTLLFAFLFVM